jgi:transketolase
MAQDSDLKVGKVIWVAGHSGPETAEDSRTHFGIFAPGVTQLFPEGQIINLHPWEHNEVAPCLTAALSTDVALIALHLTRPPVTIPDREALGMASYLAAARGAYIIKDYDHNVDKKGVVIIRGTSSTNSLVEILPRLTEEGPNVKIVAAVSWELFQRQLEDYQYSVISGQEWQDAMVITNGALRLMHKWMANRIVEEYSLSPDFDNRWRTGGSLEQIIKESKLDPQSVWDGIMHFTNDREKRLTRLRSEIPT